MNVTEFLTNLNELGVQLSADNDKLKISSPKGIITPQLKADLAKRKIEILTFLRENSNLAEKTVTGLSLQTIGRLIGGYDPSSSLKFKSPIIEPKVMAKQLKVTFRPLPKNFKNNTIEKFRAELELKLKNYEVQIIPWENATREFDLKFSIPLTQWNKTIKTKIVRTDINAVIDVERPINKIKSFIAEKIYQIYTYFFLKNKKISFTTINKLIAWAEDRTIQRLEDPTSTQVITLTALNKNFVDSKIPYQNKIAIGVNTIVETFSEIVIGVSDSNISILNMNLSDSLFSKDEFDNFVFKSLIPKIYVPIAPLPISRFQVSKYAPEQSIYGSKLVQLSQELAATGLFPSGFKLAEIIKRKSHRDIVDSIVNGRTGVSYGFVAYAEPPQYFGAIEISAEEWNSLSSVKGFSPDEIRQNEIGRRYTKIVWSERCIYKQIPDIWLICSRSGANKTDLRLEHDLIRIGLKERLYLQLPEKINPSIIDIKPSYDTYVMVALALAAALYVPELTEKGAPMIHFHGYPAKKWFESNEYYAGVDHPSVPCGTYESGVFSFLGIHNMACQKNSNLLLACVIEPDHGTNIITPNIDYLLNKLKTGIEQEQIELGGKHFASLKVTN